LNREDCSRGRKQLGGGEGAGATTMSLSGIVKRNFAKRVDAMMGVLLKMLKELSAVAGDGTSGNMGNSKVVMMWATVP